MNEQTKHAAQRTPGPYRARPIPGGPDGRYNYWIDGGEHSKPLADVRDYDDESGATAAFIVQACNAYDADQATIARLREALERILRAHDSGNNGAVMGEAVLCEHFASLARAALAHPEQQTDNGGHNEPR